MKHLKELWQTVAAYTVPVDGTTLEEIEGMFRSCDELIEAKICRASMVTFADVADVLQSSLEDTMRKLAAKFSVMEPEEQTAAAERARRIVTSMVEGAIGDALDNLAEKRGLNKNKTQH